MLAAAVAALALMVVCRRWVLHPSLEIEQLDVDSSVAVSWAVLRVIVFLSLTNPLTHSVPPSLPHSLSLYLSLSQYVCMRVYTSCVSVCAWVEL